MIIDWSKAPDGATHFSPPFSGADPLWAKQDGDRWQYRPLDLSRDWYFGVKPRADEKYIERPHAWNGEGLPPAGTVCEVVSPGYSNPRFDRFIGQRVTIVAHDQVNSAPVAVFRMPVDGRDDEQDYHALVAECFRPLRTLEQIAAEEREKSIREMVNVMDCIGDDRDCARRLYDAGYRKTAE